MNEMRFTRRSFRCIWQTLLQLIQLIRLASSTAAQLTAGCCVHNSKPRLLHIQSSRLSQPIVHAAGGDGDFSEVRQLRWGIAPASLMAEDFATALSVLPSEQHRITACTGPYRAQVLDFADTHNIPNVFTSFEDLARCSDVDAVYISPLNSMHCDLCHLMLNHDKHVLCEQPLCMDEQQVVELVAKAKARGLFLMEGMWSRCLPAYNSLRKEISKHTLGKIYQVDCELGWQLPVAKVNDSSYAGVVRNYAPNAIQLALWVYQEVPQILRVEGNVNDEGVCVSANIVLFFKENRRANLKISAENHLTNAANIHGSKGSVTIPNFWCPTLLTFNKKIIEFDLPIIKGRTNFESHVALCYELEEIRNCILGGRKESELFNHCESQLMANLITKITEMLETEREDSASQKIRIVR